MSNQIAQIENKHMCLIKPIFQYIHNYNLNECVKLLPSGIPLETFETPMLTLGDWKELNENDSETDCKGSDIQ